MQIDFNMLLVEINSALQLQLKKKVVSSPTQVCQAYLCYYVLHIMLYLKTFNSSSPTCPSWVFCFPLQIYTSY